MIGSPIAINKTLTVLIQDGKIAGDNDEEALSAFSTSAVIRSPRIDTTADDEARHSFTRLDCQNMDG